MLGWTRTGWTACINHSYGGDAQRGRQPRLPHRPRGVAPPPPRAAPGPRRPPADPCDRVASAAPPAPAAPLRVRAVGRTPRGAACAPGAAEGGGGAAWVGPRFWGRRPARGPPRRRCRVGVRRRGWGVWWCVRGKGGGAGLGFLALGGHSVCAPARGAAAGRRRRGRRRGSGAPTTAASRATPSARGVCNVAPRPAALPLRRAGGCGAAPP